jgi:eukaryotic-like serine/threonine-protein kinase
MSANQETPHTFAARWQKLNEIFAAAQELDPERQKELLEQTCGGDEALRKEAAAILAASRDAQSQGFLHADVFAAGARVLARDDIPSGTEIGDYRVIREIGRGGMGAVYLAERTGFQQQVALKIIKRGMDTEEIIRRFVRERDVLASLNHPNIARLLDGGHTTDGLPFIAMEYVEGETITAFCDQKRLAIEERIELFRKVCRAVAYAHHNLVVHRDIKPSNILVGADGEPKLLDFGIAKLLAPDVLDSTVDLTAAGANLMTPDYASPEQIRGERVTTASDIYSLGVLLYELLSGHRPFQLKNRPSLEMLRIVSEQEPRAPSTAALTEAEAPSEEDTKHILSPETVANSRRQRPEHLRKRLRGDLDTIVLTALSKDPQRRYGSVEQFSDDLQRHLAGLPVVARPATLGYRVAKFARRNRLAVVFASIALIALLGGLSVSIWQTRAANQERARAEQRFNEVRKMANTLVSGWDKDIPDSLVSNQVRGRIADISTEYLDNLARETDDPALLKELAKAYTVVGHEYTAQFIYEEKARSSLHKAEAILRRLIADTPDDVEAKRLLTECLGQYDGYFGERDRTKSLKNRLEIVELNEQIFAARPNDQKAMFDLAGAHALYGLVLKLVGRKAESFDQYRHASEMSKRRVNALESTATSIEDRAKLISAYTSMASDQAHHLNEVDAALKNVRRGADIADALYATNPQNEQALFVAGTAQFELGLILKKTGDVRGSLEAFRKGLSYSRAFLARWRNGYFIRKEYDCLMEIAEAFHELGDSGGALSALRESLELRRKLTEADKDNFRTYHGQGFHFNGGGKLLTRMKRSDEALRVYQEAEQAFRRVVEGEPNQITNRRWLATLYLRMGDLHAGLGVCDFARSQSYGGISGYEYCPPDANEITRNRNHLRRAQDYYRKAVSLLTEFETQSVAQYDDKENLLWGKQKIEVFAKSLSAGSK